jgi:hypothetical protein
MTTGGRFAQHRVSHETKAKRQKALGLLIAGFAVVVAILALLMPLSTVATKQMRKECLQWSNHEIQYPLFKASAIQKEQCEQFQIRFRE